VLTGESFTQWVIQCVRDHNTHAFYTCWQWLLVRDEVLDDDKCECQDCKAKGKYAEATMVHHVKELKKFPELALCKYYVDDEGVEHRQLISLCDDCHKVRHPERRRKKEKRSFINEERW
jgi:5-methylcytosine-specific restriction protein A